MRIAVVVFLDGAAEVTGSHGLRVRAEAVAAEIEHPRSGVVWRS